MGIFKKDPGVVKDESTKEERAAQSMKFATASQRFGKVGQRDKSWGKGKKS